jgi:hypothetical protein
MAKKGKTAYRPPQIAPPAGTGNAGPQFEAKVGAFYVLSLLAGSEPRGLPGATIRSVELQRRVDGHPLDDVIVQALNADGSPATLEIQAKRTLTFTASDSEFRDVVGQMWKAAQKPEFHTTRYELAAAIARTSTRIEHFCQELLHWARQLPDAASFADHINRKGFASEGMRDFVGVFRANLAHVAAPTDDETVWQLLRRFQILVYDFESAGSDYEHRARERARLVLALDHMHRAADLWPILIDYTAACARAGGALTHANITTDLQQKHGLGLGVRLDLRIVDARLAEEAERVLAEIHDEVGGVRLARTELVDIAYSLLDNNRILHIAGAPGCGKSAVLKRLARRLQPEGRIVALRNGRVPSGGWLPMAQLIGCQISQDELFNELGCGGGATLFIDNIDQIESAAEWATLSDLMTAVAKNRGWRAVVTGGLGSEEWKGKLPVTAKQATVATLEVESLTDNEVAVLSAQNKTLGLILSSDHPAKGIARNLFYLSRLVELGVGNAQTAAGIASELDLAKLWWRYGGGRSEDASRLARLKLLRFVGSQVITNPSHTAFKVDDLDSSTVEDLLRVHSLQEVVKGATVAFRHDVLRDWTVGFLLHENADLLTSLPTDQPLSQGLGRGLEITARLALDADGEGKRWLNLLNAVDRESCHGSWKRPILLALPRSEHALTHLNELKAVLLENSGRRLGDLLRLMIAVESIPLAKAISRIQPTIPVPAGVDDLILPKGMGWMWLVILLVAEASALPAELIPDVARVFQAWLIWTQNQRYNLNTMIVGLLFDWLTLVEEQMAPRIYKDIKDAPPPLNIPHIRDVRTRIQMSAFTFARENPDAAARYLSGLGPESVGYHDQRTILSFPGTLASAAPKEFVDFALETIIEKEDPDDLYSRRRDRYGPFGAHDHLYSRASPSLGPFLDLLDHAPAEGLRLIRALVEHATNWRRQMYRDDRQLFPRLTIHFPDGSKSFEGDCSVYHWARSIAPSTVTASALMALEAWGHKQIESGRPFADVLHDVLGPDGSSAAFLLVGVDLVLSHWPLSSEAAWPMAATPELLVFDDIRHPRDVTGVDRLDDGADTGRVKRADLEARPSRQSRLADTFGDYVFGNKPEQLTALRAALEQAHHEIKQGPADATEDAVSGLGATAARALRMTYAEHWPLVKVALQDGSETEVRQFQPEESERRLLAERRARSNEDLRDMNIRLRLQTELLTKQKAAPDILREGMEWAKRQKSIFDPAPTSVVDDDDDFNRQWDRRAVVMAAALAVRDYEGNDQGDVIEWARVILLAAAGRQDKEYRGNEQIEYNLPAIATIGLCALYVKTREASVRDLLLQLAGYHHPAVLHALGQHFAKLAVIDDRLVRSLIRIAIAGCIYFRRTDERDAHRIAQKANIDGSIEREHLWLNDASDEPAWPELPSWHLRRKRSLRLPGGAPPADDEETEIRETHAFVDERRLGCIVGYLAHFTLGHVPSWLTSLTEHLMAWTLQANGPARNERWRSDNRPFTWNCDFFDFAGVLAVALPHNQVTSALIVPIAQLQDDAFHDLAAAFLRGFDRATFAIDTKTPQNPADVRRSIAGRIKEGWNYRRFQDEKTFTCETHAGDALTAMFYQPPAFMNRGRTSLPAKWTGLDATIETLTDLAVGAPTSGYIAFLFLNLIDTSPRAALLPFVLDAATAWSSAYGADTNFWSEQDVGGRLCAWIDRTIGEDPAATAILSEVRDRLFRCIDVLVRSGVAQASEVESRIAGLLANQLTV